MKKSIFLVVILLTATFASVSQTLSNIQKATLSQGEINRIVQKFTENEKQFRSALNEYVFSRSATMQTVGIGGNITGTFRRDSDMTFTSEGNRIEKITFFPVPTLTEITVTPEDLEDLGGVNPFALEPGSISMYDFTFVGKEKIDDLNLFVFDVTPKVVPDPKKSKLRLFTGRVWVDDQDLMIVKSKGKAVPETKENKFPVVETWRENIDGKYWFPSYASSDDELVFDSGQVVKLKMRVKYFNYKYGHTDVKIIGEEDTPTPKPTPSPTPAPKKP
jgi:hypothetical protein